MYYHSQYQLFSRTASPVAAIGTKLSKLLNKAKEINAFGLIFQA